MSTLVRADGSDIYLGRDVLRGLLDGIDRQLDPLMASARQFLLGLAAASEDFDTPHKTPSPELVEAEIDFEAIEEIAIEHLRSRHEDSDGDDGETD